MKRNLIGILSLVVMSVMMNATAQAQAVAKANVPFAFKVGPAQLPAGTYEVQAISDNAVTIKNRNSKAGALSLVRHDPPRNTGSKLVFHRLAGPIFPGGDLGSTGHHWKDDPSLQTGDELGEGTAGRRPTERQRRDLDRS